jgi:predicted naringenin-chalcone synthase
MAVFAREAPRLVETAARELFGSPALGGRVPRPVDVDHVIVVSCTGFVAPGLDVALIRRLGLRPDVGRTLVGFQGCQAGLSALRLAEALATADPTRSVLIVAVELSTLHFQYKPTDANLMANALFGDGAAAVLVDGYEVARGAGVHLRIDETSTHLLPEGESDMRWCVGDHGFTLALSDRLPRILERHAPMLLEPRGGADGYDRIWAVHPGGGAILDAVARALRLDDRALDVARAALRDHGNLSSATIFFVLERMMRELAAPQVVTARDAGCGVPMTALAFGPGLTIETARLTAHVQREDDERCTRGPIYPHAATSES